MKKRNINNLSFTILPLFSLGDFLQSHPTVFVTLGIIGLSIFIGMKIWRQIFKVFLMIGLVLLVFNFVLPNIEKEELSSTEMENLSVHQMGLGLPVQTPPPEPEKRAKYEPKHSAKSSATSLNKELQSGVTYKSVERAQPQEDKLQTSSTTGAPLAYYLQVASFNSLQYAHEAAKTLRTSYPDFVYIGMVDNKYCIFIGRFDSSWETKQFRKGSNFPDNCSSVDETMILNLEILV